MNGIPERTQVAPRPLPEELREGAHEPFRAVLTPHRSLGPKGFLALMIVFGAMSFVTGLLFLSIGAWPVAGFLGLDVLLVCVAFRLNYRTGRVYETLDLTPASLVLTRVHPSGRQERFDCNPYWARVNLREGSDGRTALSIVSRGTELAFGAFLTDAERRGLAAELRAALLAARGGVRI
jgi:uncharacterized membrane protein